MRSNVPRARKVRYPLGTVARYGPDTETVTKIAVAIQAEPDGDIVAIERWLGDDVEDDPRAMREIIVFLKRHRVRTILRSPAVLGCPHEEGKDFPSGQDCPECEFWKGKQGSGGDDILRWQGLTKLYAMAFDPLFPPRTLW